MFPVLICCAYDYDERIKFCFGVQPTSSRTRRDGPLTLGNDDSSNVGGTQSSSVSDWRLTEKTFGSCGVSAEETGTLP